MNSLKQERNILREKQEHSKKEHTTSPSQQLLQANRVGSHHKTLKRTKGHEVGDKLTDQLSKRQVRLTEDVNSNIPPLLEVRRKFTRCIIYTGQNKQALLFVFDLLLLRTDFNRMWVHFDIFIFYFKFMKW